jgi:hypothetical protein
VLPRDDLTVGTGPGGLEPPDAAEYRGLRPSAADERHPVGDIGDGIAVCVDLEPA